MAGLKGRQILIDRDVLLQLVKAASCAEEEGPAGEGWLSSETEAAIEEAEKLLGVWQKEEDEA